MRVKCNSSGNNHFSKRMHYTLGKTFLGRFASFVYMLSLSMLLMVCFTQNRSTGQSEIIAEVNSNSLTSSVFQIMFHDFIGGTAIDPQFKEAHSGYAFCFSFIADNYRVASHPSDSTAMFNDESSPEMPVLWEAIFKLLSVIIVSFLFFFVVPGVGAYIISQKIY